jgi:hypothetical protein
MFFRQVRELFCNRTYNSLIALNSILNSLVNLTFSTPKHVHTNKNKMKMTYPVTLIPGHYSLSTNNGESSQTPQPKIKRKSISPIPKTEDVHPNKPYLATDWPSHTRFADHRPMPDVWYAALNNTIVKIEPQTEEEARLSKQELIEYARRVNSLLLKAQADAVPHINYPSTTFTNLATKTGTPNNTAPTNKVHFTPLHNHHNRTTKRLPTPFPKIRPAPLHADNSPNRISKGRPAACSNALPYLLVATKTFHCASDVYARARASGDQRPLIKFYSKRMSNLKAPRFYRRRFLAGPLEKTEVGDKRIFYEREFI